jgi:hypothetical protein
MVVRIRFCPSCGDLLNPKVVSGPCLDEKHTSMRRSRSAYCMDCGAGLAQGSASGA